MKKTDGFVSSIATIRSALRRHRLTSTRQHGRTLAASILALLSMGGSFIHGTDIAITGGQTVTSIDSDFRSGTLLISGPGSTLHVGVLFLGSDEASSFKIIVKDGGALITPSPIMLAFRRLTFTELNIGAGGAAGFVSAPAIYTDRGSARIHFQSHRSQLYVHAKYRREDLCDSNGPGNDHFDRKQYLHRGRGVPRHHQHADSGRDSPDAKRQRAGKWGRLPRWRNSGTGRLLNIDRLLWRKGYLQFAPAAGDILNIAQSLNDLSEAGPILIDPTGMSLGNANMSLRLSARRTSPCKFTAQFINVSPFIQFQGMFLLNDSFSSRSQASR